jgi:hypothetical protein
MGKGIVYCHDCGKLLREDLFSRGRAHVVEDRPYCTECRSPDRTPPTGAVPKVQTRTLKPPAARPVPGKPGNPKLPLYVGGALAGAALLVLLVVLASGGGSSPAPPPPPPPATDASLRTVEELEAFGAKSEDPDETLVRVDRARAALRGKHAARVERVEARAVELRLARERDRGAQVETFVADIVEVVREDPDFARREEVLRMWDSAAASAGARAEEFRRRKRDYEEAFEKAAQKAADEARAAAEKLAAQERYAEAVERLDGVPAAFRTARAGSRLPLLREELARKHEEQERAAKVMLEGEDLKVLSSAGTVQPQSLKTFGEAWSKGVHLWWRQAKPGDLLRLEFPSNVAGRRRLVLAMTRAPDYGIFRLSVNGEVVSENLDLFFEKGVIHSGEIAWDVDLRKGPNELKVEVTGSNPSAKPAHFMFGLDYLRIE